MWVLRDNKRTFNINEIHNDTNYCAHIPNPFLSGDVTLLQQLEILQILWYCAIIHKSSYPFSSHLIDASHSCFSLVTIDSTNIWYSCQESNLVHNSIIELSSSYKQQ